MLCGLQQREEFERSVDCVSAELCYEGCSRGKKLSAVLTVLALNCLMWAAAEASSEMRNARLDNIRVISGSSLTQNTPQLSRRPTTKIIAVLRDNRTELTVALYGQSAEQFNVAGGTYRYQYVLRSVMVLCTYASVGVCSVSLSKEVKVKVPVRHCGCYVTRFSDIIF